MKCPHCNSECQDNAKFCSQCGNILSGESLALSITDAARFVGVTSQTILNLIERGCLTLIGSGDHRKTYVSRESVMIFLDSYPDFKVKVSEIKKLKEENNRLRKKQEAIYDELLSKPVFEPSPISDDVFNYICKIYLSEKENKILHDFFFKKLELQEIADELDMTRERVRQIKERAIKKLRNLSSRQHESFENCKNDRDRFKYLNDLCNHRIAFLEGLLRKNGIEYKFENLPINILHLDTRMENRLADAGICTVSQLADSSESALLKIQGIGYKGIDKMNRALYYVGLDIADKICDEDDEDDIIVFNEDD